jgi:ATP-dependent DNA helicase PIF1
VINSWKQLLNSNVNQPTAKVSAPTGVAAYLINGETLHSLLFLPIGRRFNSLKGAKLESLQNRFKNIKFIIIDEFSMVGCKMFHQIDQRLREASNVKDKIFGGFSVIIVGDTKQLPPVFDKRVWHNIRPNDSEEIISGKVVYDSFTDVVHLTEQVRQSGSEQEQFRNLLNRLRDCESTVDDWKLLLPRMNLPSNSAERKALDDAIFIMPKNNDVDIHNAKQLDRLNIEHGYRTCRIDGVHTGKNAVNICADQLGGLEASIFISRNCKVMLTSNLWTDVGLVNGAFGIVRHIIYEPNCGPPSLPLSVIIEMNDGYSGPSLEGFSKYIAIGPKTAVLENAENDPITRIQYPLKVAYATTIHKSQGSTIKLGRVDLGKSDWTANLTSVALSRFSNLNGLYLSRIDSLRLTNIKQEAGRKDHDDLDIKKIDNTLAKYNYFLNN